MTPGALWWIASYPKSGNTWMRAFIRNALDDGAGAADINALATGGIASGRPWLDDVLGIDSADLHPAEIAALRPGAHDWSAREAAQPVFQKVHDACERDAQGRALLGDAARGALYIVRNPLDVASSAADHWGVPTDEAIARMNDDAARLSARAGMLQAQVPQRLGSWAAHVLGWVDAPPCPLLVLRYEDLLSDPLHAFGRAADFLGLGADPPRIERAWRHSAFEVLAEQEVAQGFRERGAGERFFRRGRAGGWREELDAAQVARLVDRHAPVMQRFGYLDDAGRPR